MQNAEVSQYAVVTRRAARWAARQLWWTESWRWQDDEDLQAILFTKAWQALERWKDRGRGERDAYVHRAIWHTARNLVRDSRRASKRERATTQLENWAYRPEFLDGEAQAEARVMLGYCAWLYVREDWVDLQHYAQTGSVRDAAEIAGKAPSTYYRRLVRLRRQGMECMA